MLNWKSSICPVLIMLAVSCGRQPPQKKENTTLSDVSIGELNTAQGPAWTQLKFVLEQLGPNQYTTEKVYSRQDFANSILHDVKLTVPYGTYKMSLSYLDASGQELYKSCPAELDREHSIDQPQYKTDIQICKFNGDQPSGQVPVGPGESDVIITPKPVPDQNLIWKKANLTNYTSYPDPGSVECLKYNGCQWAGMFAALPEKQPESWVKANNIIAIHSKDFDKYKLKTLRLRKGSNVVDARVYDMCSDSDCAGCCTQNSKSTGFLIDVESYTAKRFGVDDGVIEWTCIDCK